MVFIIVLEVLSREFRTSCPWELLYANDLRLIAKILDLLMEKFKLWKDNMENKGLHVNMGKTIVMNCGKGFDTTKLSGKYPCSICRRRVWGNSISCTSGDPWAHKKCSEIKVRLVDIPDFKCHKCLGLARPVDGRPAEHVSLKYQKLEVVEFLVYLGDGTSSNWVSDISTIARIHSACAKFRKLLTLLTKYRRVIVFSCRPFPKILKYRDHWRNLLTIWKTRLLQTLTEEFS